jgi:hypothetical protein
MTCFDIRRDQCLNYGLAPPRRAEPLARKRVRSSEQPAAVPLLLLFAANSRDLGSGKVCFHRSCKCVRRVEPAKQQYMRSGCLPTALFSMSTCYGTRLPTRSATQPLGLLGIGLRDQPRAARITNRGEERFAFQNSDKKNYGCEPPKMPPPPGPLPAGQLGAWGSKAILGILCRSLCRNPAIPTRIES